MSSIYFLGHKYYKIKYISCIQNPSPHTVNVSIGLQRNSWWARLSGGRAAWPKVFSLLLGACCEPEEGHPFENGKAVMKELVLMFEIQYDEKGKKKKKYVKLLMFCHYSHVLYQGRNQ